MSSSPDARHSFVIPAYGFSPYLRDCIQSLQAQRVSSSILVTSSTPSPELSALCAELSVELRINADGGSISRDWNYAYEQANSAFVTLAHQDDIYDPAYTECLLPLMQSSASTLIAFSDYNELVDGQVRSFNALLFVKRCILFAVYGFGRSIGAGLRKRLLVSFGSPISCPTVMFNKALIGAIDFSAHFQVNLDWDAWRRLSLRKGRFACTRRRLVLHRIYADSQTTYGLRSQLRQTEDREIFHQLWPAFIARLLSKVYALCYPSNEVNT